MRMWTALQYTRYLTEAQFVAERRMPRFSSDKNGMDTFSDELSHMSKIRSRKASARHFSSLKHSLAETQTNFYAMSEITTKIQICPLSIISAHV